ncbi:cobalt ECF transporter T component CbiQ [Fundidesulfovibrio putealis]|uniref:cobalt ECF transporter T component CbiQ n=1 Tax=Fundidesulfovibrio putealis TaxID=270496 RepID=UPI0003F52139|nr:cobalt ECF transporter T component CbiQ [Fundidesulfovibrio putealis]
MSGQCTQDAQSGLDPRSRLLCAFGLCVAVAVCRSWPAALAGLGFGAACLALNSGRWGMLARRLALVNVFFLGLLATVPLAVPGETLLRLGSLAFTREGLMLALHMTAKGNAIFLIFWGLVQPLSPPRLGSALSALGVPDKLCLILSLTFRYLDLMRHEWDRLVTAARLRGFTPGTSRRAWGTYGLLLALLFMRAMDKSAAIHQAMICRGFDGRFRSLGGLRWRTADTALGVAALAGIVLVAVLERGSA